MSSYRVALLGAAGAVGQELLRVLVDRNFPVGELKLLATSRSAGHKFTFRGEELTVEEVSQEAFRGVDICFFAAGNEASKVWAPVAVRGGAVVIDKASVFRMEKDIPLVVPEVNGEAIRGHKGIIASPNCSTIQMVVPLKPLHDAAGLKRVVVSSYQSVSGTGRDAMDELAAQGRAFGRRALGGGGEGYEGWMAHPGEDYPRSIYPRQIAYNVLPQCDNFGPGGYTGEEVKFLNETRKIMGLPDLPVTMTCTRVPVFVGHSESVLVEFERTVTPAEAREALSRFPGVRVVDDPANFGFPTAIDVAGTDETLVGRIRADLTNPRGLWLWVVSDNL
ncbi:MAG: aspartate-semialdehyde dehydrogenase, partial [Bacillota bacterium]